MTDCNGCVTKLFSEKMTNECKNPPCRYAGFRDNCPCIECLVKVVRRDKINYENFISGPNFGSL